MSFQALGVILGKLLQAAPKLSNARLASDFTAMAQAIAAQQTALAKIVPPAQYTGPYDDLIATFSPVAVDLGSIAADARTGNATSATSDTEKLIRDAAKLKNAERALAKTLGLGT
jgi:hypothetical protein